jgi:hypothetical protein
MRVKELECVIFNAHHNPILITPLAVDVGNGHTPRVSPRWVVERVEGCYHVVGLSC